MKEILKNINDALHEAWKVEDDCLPEFIAVPKELADRLIVEHCHSKKKRQRKKWAKQHGFRRLREEEL